MQRLQPRAAHSARADGESSLPGTYESVLYLHIQAVADYFSSNYTLMQHPPAVDVDIILDRYLGNVFPQSLLSTAGYLIVLVLLAWPVSHAAWLFLKPGTAKLHND